jgi:hypothetical protein
MEGSCTVIAEETAKIASGEGFTSCPKCTAKVWHASCHGCHCVKCPMCTLKFCHACSVPYNDRLANCKCPIFCREEFSCKCAKKCPECEKTKCEHCDGTCENCLSNRRQFITNDVS